MVDKTDVDIAALIQRNDLVLQAIRRGSLEAMKQYIQAGESMVSWEDGRVVYITPEELKKIVEEVESAFGSG